MMWWSGSGSGGSGWWWPVLFMAICVVVMVRMMNHRWHGPRWGERPESDPTGAERVLAERLARGDIDIDEYEHRLTALRDGSGAASR